MDTQRLPLFPLDLVLFPGCPLPLHIFEPRYKVMIRRCVEENLEFGVVLQREDRLASVGCTAAVLGIARTYPDGKMDILTEGRRPCQILELFHENPYTEANVEFLAEEQEAAATATGGEALEECFAHCFELIFGAEPDKLAPKPSQPLSYRIGGQLPFDLDFRQDLLEMRRESERRHSLLLRMREWIPQLEQEHRMRRKAGGNGHGLA